MCSHNGEPSRFFERGMALIAVLWVVAALSVVASGMLALTRGHSKALASYQNQVLADARGDAAINLATRHLLEEREGTQRYQRLSYEIDGYGVEVEVVPASGLISLNGAPEGLLSDLFIHAGGVSAEKAHVLAQRVIDWRDPDGVAMPDGAENDAYREAGSAYSARNGRFQVAEDLLQVLGVDLDLYVRIAGLVTVESPHALVDPAAAPEEVLRVLAGGDGASAKNLVEKRSGVGNGQFVVGGATLSNVGSGFAQAVFRLEARVAMPDSTLRRRRMVRIDASDKGRYWKTLRVWPSSVVPKATSNE